MTVDISFGGGSSGGSCLDATHLQRPRRELPRRRSRLRVVLADDHAILRQGLRAILHAEPDLEVIGEASNVQGTQSRCCAACSPMS